MDTERAERRRQDHDECRRGVFDPIVDTESRRVTRGGGRVLGSRSIRSNSGY